MPNSPAERIAPERLAEIIELNGKKTWGNPNSAVSHCAALLGHIAELEAENAKLREAISPGRIGRTVDYYCGVVKRFREGQLEIRALAAQDKAGEHT